MRFDSSKRLYENDSCSGLGAQRPRISRWHSRECGVASLVWIQGYMYRLADVPPPTNQTKPNNFIAEDMFDVKRPIFKMILEEVIPCLDGWYSGLVFEMHSAGSGSLYRMADRLTEP